MKEKITPGQLGILCCCGLLATMFQVAPGTGAAPAEAGAWLSPLAALATLLPPVWVLVRACRVLPRGGGLERIYTQAFGTGAGRLLTGLTGLWAVLCAAVALRYYSESLVSTVYPETGIWIFLLGVTAVVWRASGRGVAVLCRMAKVFLPIICGVLALVCLLALREVKLYYLWPVRKWRGVITAALPVVGVQAPVMLILFRRTEAPGTMRGGRILTLWLTVSALILTIMRTVVIGMFGWQTGVRLLNPLFSAAKEVYLMEVFERIEALVVAVWVFSDLIWIAALLDAAAHYCAGALGRSTGKGWLGAVTLLMLAAAGWSQGDAVRLRQAVGHEVLAGSVAVCLLLPVAGVAVARLRGRI